ncbi:MAG: CRISPR-associated endonuclease Cas2 [Clostridia bacterium]|nr:CRISPR-associated endonuclease Cas2 [Clostridia bacterium]
MLVLVSYDVSTITPKGKKRLHLVAKECVKFGQRVQNSVFECYIDYSQFVMIKNNLLKIIDDTEDNLRFYLIGNNYKAKVEKYGKKESYSVGDTVIV